MDQSEQKIVDLIATQFRKMDCEGPWTNIDESLCHLAYLDDNELLAEAQILSEKHKSGKPRCTKEHPIERCIAPLIVAAANSVLDHYEDTGKSLLDPTHKMILQYYLALDYEGEIVY